MSKPKKLYLNLLQTNTTYNTLKLSKTKENFKTLSTATAKQASAWSSAPFARPDFPGWEFQAE